MSIFKTLVANLEKIILYKANDLLTSEVTGNLTFVGVGPGDPSLLTIAAVNAIKKANLVAYPVADEGLNSLAAEIAFSFIKNKRQLPLLFPMTSESPSLKRAWRVASEKLIKSLRDNSEVVLLCQGDVSLYSTSSYIIFFLKEYYPKVNFKVIPGINSFSAASASGHWPLALQDDQLLICKTPDTKPALREIIEEAIKLKRNIILLKLGRRWEWVRKVLQDYNLLRNSLFAQRVGFPDQLILNADSIKHSEVPYFSLLIIRTSLPRIMPEKIN